MNIKAIIFDIDGVVIKSNEDKEKIVKDILIKYDLYDIPGVKDIFSLGLNRNITLDKIYELKSFDKQKILGEITEKKAVIESNPIPNNHVIDFIKNNNSKYIISTNTALPRAGLDRVIKALDIGSYFKDFLSYDEGNKSENINFILNKYKLDPKEVLFIDDHLNNIIDVEDTSVHTLHFNNYDISIEDYIKNLK